MSEDNKMETVTIASEEEVMLVSEQLMEQNKEAYEVLAK